MPMKGKKVVLTAEHLNCGKHTIYDWQKTKFTLFEDGTLQSVVFAGGTIVAHKRIISNDDLMFIKDNIRSFISRTPELDVYDGDGWIFEGPDYTYDFGYVYGTDLEKIVKIIDQEIEVTL